MALGSEGDESVNHKQAVHQRVREFQGLLSGAERERIRYRSDPVFSVWKQRTRRMAAEVLEPFEINAKRKHPVRCLVGRRLKPGRVKRPAF
jgi:hypothetical protein